jgi:hypothetical protein
MWKRTGDDPAHYCSTWAISTYWVFKKTRRCSKSYPPGSGRSSWIDCKQRSILQVNSNQRTGEWQLQAELEPQHNYGQNSTFPPTWHNFHEYDNKEHLDTAVPNTKNLVTEKQEKYRELANEISAMWKQNIAKVTPIVISTSGVISTLLSQSLKRPNWHPNTYIQMQKSVILGTCSVVRNFLNYK